MIYWLVVAGLFAFGLNRAWDALHYVSARFAEQVFAFYDQAAGE